MNQQDIKNMVRNELIEGILKFQDFYVVGNWKMNKTKQEVISFLNTVKDHDFGEKNHVVVIPSTPYLYLFEEKLRYSKVAYGVQNVFHEQSGAYTGETSIQQAHEFGARYAIIGHSERRTIFQESNELVAKKVKACVTNKMKPIMCIGEELALRENHTYRDFLIEQMRTGLRDLTEKELEKVIIAYEPIWAIGTGVTATPNQVEETHVFLRTFLTKEYGEVGKNIPLLYGGSVKPSNVLELALAESVSGFLIGGASLDAASFITINDILNGTNN